MDVGNFVLIAIGKKILMPFDGEHWPEREREKDYISAKYLS